MKSLLCNSSLLLTTLFFIAFSNSCVPYKVPIIQIPDNLYIDKHSLTLPQRPDVLPKIQKKVAFGFIKDKPSHIQKAFYDVIGMVLSRDFESAYFIGIANDKQALLSLLDQQRLKENLDNVLIISDIKEEAYSYKYTGVEYSFKLTTENLQGEKKSEGIFSANGEAPSFQGDIKQLIINALHNIAEKLEANLLNFRIEDKFLKYGFDIWDFMRFARTNLKARGDIRFDEGLHSINLRTFKDKLYVEVKIGYRVTYNTLRVSMYESASMTFDEVVKKLTKKISTDFKKQDSIDGFIFNVTYTDKDFLKEYDDPKIVVNEFVLPKEACRKYANLDITNQDLINQSIVLVDGERISLNLQTSR